MASSSGIKGLCIRNISRMLDSDKFVIKLSDYNDELFDTGKSSGANFSVQQDAVLLPDIGDDRDVGEGACVTESSFLWKDLDNYNRHSTNVYCNKWAQLTNLEILQGSD
jgi:hypothetical protein